MPDRPGRCAGRHCSAPTRLSSRTLLTRSIVVSVGASPQLMSPGVELVESIASFFSASLPPLLATQPAWPKPPGWLTLAVPSSVLLMVP